MTAMEAGLETLAGRAGQKKSAEDNDGDGSWAAGRAGQRKSAEDNDGDGSWAGDTCWESRTKEVGRRQ